MQSLAERPIDCCCNTWPGETQIVCAIVVQALLIPDSWWTQAKWTTWRQSQGRYQLRHLKELIRLILEQSTNVCVYILYCFSTSPNWALNLNRLGTWTELTLYDSIIIIRLVHTNLNIFIVGLIEYIYSNFGQPCCYTGECNFLLRRHFALYVWFKLDRVHCWGL